GYPNQKIFQSSISVVDQLPIMMNSVDSHHQEPRSITKSSSSFRVCCDGSRSASIDVFILIPKFITVKAVFNNFADSEEVVYIRRSAAYQAIKIYKNYRKRL
ncbi:hypothetical protein HID58_066242, partial [Brassica napus]